MSYKPKFKKGKKIETMAGFDFALEFDKCIYFFNKPLHFGFIQNWQYNYIKTTIKRGQLFKAVRVK